MRQPRENYHDRLISVPKLAVELSFIHGRRRFRIR